MRSPPNCSKAPDRALIRRLTFAVVLLAVVTSACTPPVTELPTADLTVGGNELVVAVADNIRTRSAGLRGLESLPAGIDGMLFVFDRPRITSFTMEDTLIPLDVWFFDDDGALVGSDVMEPCPDGDCISYQPEVAIRWALETPRGELNLSSSDRISTIENR